MILIGVNPALLPRLHKVAGEREHVVSFVPQCPAVQLDEARIIVTNLYVFVGFITALDTIIKDICDPDVSRR